MAWPNCFSRSKKSVLMCVFPPWKAPHPKKSPPNRKSPPLVGFIRALFVTFRIDWTASGYSNRTCFPCYQLSTNAPSSWDSQPSFFCWCYHWHPLIQRHNGDRKLFGVKQQDLPKELLKFVFHELSFLIKVFCWWCRNTGLCDLWKRPGSSSRGCCQGDKGFVMYYMYCTALHKVSNCCYAHDKCVQWTVDAYLCILLWAYHSIMIQTLPIVHLVIAWRSLPPPFCFFFWTMHLPRGSLTVCPWTYTIPTRRRMRSLQHWKVQPKNGGVLATWTRLGTG